jgi:NDP-sugar pyrophosphorylase family protein
MTANAAPRELPIKEAMLLSAGMATRLAPLSGLRPKALFPLPGGPILRQWLDTLAGGGVRRVVVNAFHLAHMIEDAVAAWRDSYPGMEIVVLREPELLGTGGGVRNALGLFGGPFMVLNSDIHTDLPLCGLCEAHISQGSPLATIAAGRLPGGTVSAAEDGSVLAFRAAGPVKGEAVRLYGLGMMVLSLDAAGALPLGNSDLIMGLAGRIRAGGRVMAFVPDIPLDGSKDGYQWSDLGTMASYHALNRRLAEGKILAAEGSFILGRVSGFLVAEAGATVSDGAMVEDCVLWSEARVGRGCELRSMVVAGKAMDGLRMSGGAITG